MPVRRKIIFVMKTERKTFKYVNSVSWRNQEKTQYTVQCHPANGVSGAHMTQLGSMNLSELHPQEAEYF